MSLAVEYRKVNDVAILDLAGRITLGEDTNMLRDELISLIALGEKKILVNLARVTYLDSAGLGELVGAYSTVTRHGGALKLLHLQRRLRDLMQITKLHTVFRAFDDEGAALASY